jgi:hypothetical protein
MRLFARSSKHATFRHHHHHHHHQHQFSDPHSRTRAELEVIADHHRDAEGSGDLRNSPEPHVTDDSIWSIEHQRVA